MIKKLKTDRLILRPFTMNDTLRVQELAGNEEVAKTTLSIPHPYPVEAAENWIRNHSLLIKNGTYPLAITLKNEGLLIGTMTLRVDKAHQKGELAYWIGKDYWGNGFATEAAKVIVRYGFQELNLNKIWAKAMSKNPASTKVMEKVGMKKEGKLIQDIYKSGTFEDSELYGLVKSDYRS